MVFKREIVFLVSFLIIIGGIVYLGLYDEKQSQVTDDPNVVVYYYGAGCSHCKVVNDFLEANPVVSEKVSFEKKEVWSDKTNAQEMERRAKECNLTSDEIGVPFLYGGNGKCYIGEPDVIGFFKEKSGIEMQSSAVEIEKK